MIVRYAGLYSDGYEREWVITNDGQEDGEIDTDMMIVEED